MLTRLDEMEREPVRKLGEYDLLEELDHGGMGVVWRVRHRELGRTMALKMIRGGEAAGESEVMRFRTEAEAVARLEHPGVVPVYELGEVDGLPFFTMPLMEGGSLASRLEKGKPLPNREAAEILVKVARAVAHAHSRGVLHRDLKPANILFDAAGAPHVADFGLARLMGSDSGLTKTGAVLGTPAYAAPEQVRGDPPTTAGDIYSLGAILYHLLCGRPAWIGRDALDVLRQSSLSEPPAPKSLNPSADRDLQIITLRCLEREPSRRYATADALADDLDRWLRGEPIHARPSSQIERLWKWVRRRPATAALIAMGLASLAAVIMQRIVSERQVRAESEAARRAEAETRQTAAQLRLNLYASDMALAFGARQEGNYTLARRILANQSPPPGAEDLRGWEWRWLQRGTAGGEALVLGGHTRPVYAVTFSPDNSLLASAGADGIIRLWKMPEGEPAGEIPRPDNRNTDDAKHVLDQLALAPKLLRFPEIYQASLRDPVEFNLIGANATPGALRTVNTLSFSPDGSLLAAGTERNAKVWRVSDGRMEHVIPFEHSMATFHPREGRLFLTSGYNRTYATGEGKITVWKLPELEREQQDFGMSSVPLTFIRGGDSYVGGHREDSVWERSPADGRIILTSAASRGHRLLAATTAEDGTFGATSDTRGPEVHAGRTGDPQMATLSCGRAMVSSLAISPDGQMLAAGCNDHAIRLWGRDLRERPALRGHGGAVQCVAFSPDGHWLASAGDDYTTRVWSTVPATVSERWHDVTGRMLVHANGMLLGHVNDGVQLWDGSRHVVLLPVEKIPGGPGVFRSAWPLGFSSDGKRAAVLRFRSEEGTVQNGDGALDWFNTGDGTLHSSVPLAGQIFFRGAVLSPDGRQLVRQGGRMPFLKGSSLVLLNAETAGALRTGRMDLTNINIGAFTPDGRHFVIGCENQRLQIFDTATLALLWQVEGAVDRSVLFTADGTALVAAMSGQIHLYETLTGRERAVLSGHTSAVQHLALHPGGRTLISASADRTVRAWHLPTARELGIIYASTESAVASLTFSADGETLIAGRENAPALVW